MTPLIEFKNVSKCFGELTVLDNINFSLFSDSVTTVIGKSGVGKSVLLKHIIGLIQPDKGEILFNGQTQSSMNSKQKRSIRKKFSYMFQNMALFDSMTVYENISLPLREKRLLPLDEIDKKVIALTEELELVGMTKYPSQISGGMKKRVALARALITDPEIVLFDEPTTGLDPIRKNAVFRMISNNQKKFGYTGIVVSHCIPDVFHISDRVAMLEKGKIIFDGSSKDIKHCEDPVVKGFIEGSAVQKRILR